MPLFHLEHVCTFIQPDGRPYLLLLQTLALSESSHLSLCHSHGNNVMLTVYVVRYFDPTFRKTNQPIVAE